jgi:predicted transcriptional regulator
MSDDRREQLLLGKLDKIQATLQHILALELAREGVTKQQIAKHLHVAKATVVSMLKGTKKRSD